MGDAVANVGVTTPDRTRSRDVLLEAWLAHIPSGVQAPTDEQQAQMRELVILFREYLEGDSEDLADDISTTAYDLALMGLRHLGRRDVIRAYRDAFQQAVLGHVRLTANTTVKLLSFFNIITDTYWRAYSDKLRRAVRAQHQEALAQELLVAKRIQQRLLPKVTPRIPGFDIAGRVLPAREVGGDYWSAKYYKEDGVVTLKLADISGHGVAAATLVAAVKFISGGFYPNAKSASWVIERTNHVLVKETPADVLVTMVYGWLRPERREMDFVNAGHDPALFLSGTEFTRLPPTGPVLGLMETTYREIKLKFRPGDLFFTCSDGVMEAGTPRPFGEERLKEVILKHRDSSCDALADAVVQAVLDYTSGTPEDDISVLALKALGPKDRGAGA